MWNGFYTKYNHLVSHSVAFSQELFSTLCKDPLYIPDDNLGAYVVTKYLAKKVQRIQKDMIVTDKN